MTNIAALHELADSHDISIDYIQCPECGSMSLSLDGKCYIGIDKNATDKEELVHTAHELGHCETGSFYNRYSKFNIISKYEYKADKWAIQQLMPIEEFVNAVNEGCTEPWQLADYFGVTEDFVLRAYDIYKAMSMFD